MITELIYNRSQPITLMDLSQYGIGKRVTVRREGQRINVNEDERRHLLKMYTGRPEKGGVPLFREKKEKEV